MSKSPSASKSAANYRVVQAATDRMLDELYEADNDVYHLLTQYWDDGLEEVYTNTMEEARVSMKSADSVIRRAPDEIGSGYGGRLDYAAIELDRASKFVLRGGSMVTGSRNQYAAFQDVANTIERIANQARNLNKKVTR